MSEQGGSTPRRAMPPREDPPAKDADAKSSRLRPWSSTGSRKAAPGTPIPPPAVLPASDVPAAAAGRRFSAVDLPSDEDRPLPRRSALSPAATRARSPESPAAPGAAAGPRSVRPVWIGVASVAAVGALVAALFVFRPGGPAGPAATATPTIDPVATYLLQPADLSALTADATWDAATTDTDVTPTTPQAKCVLTAAETGQAPLDSMVRTFAPSGDMPGALLHQVDNYASVEEAQTAYAARVGQVADCTRNTAWVSSGISLDGLADQASGVKLVLQDVEPEYHTILVTRTGTRVNVIDATHPEASVDAGTLAPALAGVAGRQCAAGGTCPTEVVSGESVPPMTDPPGWLASVDLPRITAGFGQWRGTAEVRPSVDSAGTRCEAVDLADISGATARQQRTYLLQDDTSAPANFGVDELLYTFGTAEEADALVGTLTANIDGCADRAATASVARTGDLSGTGTGAAWVVTQKVDQQESTARFRSAVLGVGNRVIYLLANPSAEFDFSDEAWHNVALRAADRTTQLP